MINLAALAIFSGLSVNLLLTLALGTANIANPSESGGGMKLPLIQSGIFLGAILILWVFFSSLSPSLRGFSEFFLYFPLSALICMGLELLCDRLLPRIIPSYRGLCRVYPAHTAYNGLIPIALLFCLLMGHSFGGALVLSLGFALGNLGALLCLKEIRRRSELEWVPRFLRGSPLILISMGLLSLVTTSVAGIFFNILLGF